MTEKKKIQMAGTEIESALCPLFWQHGESKEELIEEISKMYGAGIGGFIVESRPHPDFLSYGWWRDLDVIIQAAAERNMSVWIFDDCAYPSGLGAGKIKELYPEAVKRYIAKQQIDAAGPLEGASVQVKSWLGEDDVLFRVIAGERANGRDKLLENSLIDITDQVRDGILYWDIPRGNWRIFILYITGEGGEEWTKDYVNPISKTAVSRYIDVIYEEHYKRYHEEFGATIKGFFIDEPRFGSASSYESTLGKTGYVYPWSEEAQEGLEEEFGKDIVKLLPLLWSCENDACSDVQYAYMNVVSRLFADDFVGQIGNWCRAHKVKVIGHIVEDNGAHARLGFGPGHYFRSMEGFDMAGLDVVYQVWPEYQQGFHTTPFGYLDCDFFYWGLAKMASSAAHIDKKKQGMTMCEIFGAYGWQEGLKLMKWLTDHVCVRGVNMLVPHAFSPKYPDADCPPHFYAKGKNPQWRYFERWSDYANRVCCLLSNGIHHATAAVLYHAEAEWGGQYQPFEKAVRVLARAQIDCDVIPGDIFQAEDKAVCTKHKLKLEQEEYEVVIVPYGECLPAGLLEALDKTAQEGIEVLFVDDYPRRAYYQGEECHEIEALKKNKNVHVCRLEQIAQWMKERGYFDVSVGDFCPNLRCMHYEKNGKAIYFFTNESKFETVETRIALKEDGKLMLYDPMEDEFYPLQTDRDGRFLLTLAPYASIFVLREETNVKIGKRLPVIGAASFKPKKCMEIYNDWRVSVEDGNGGFQRLSGSNRLQNISAHEILPAYSGTIRYETTIQLEEDMSEEDIVLDLGSVYEIGEVFVNGICAGSRICPPYVYRLTGCVTGENQIRVDVTNTFAKEKIGNIFDRAMPQEPSGLLGPVRLYSYSL